MADLQRHHAIVLTVDGAHDLGPALAAEDLEQFVTVPDNAPPHGRNCRGCPLGASPAAARPPRGSDENGGGSQAQLPHTLDQDSLLLAEDQVPGAVVRGPVPD